MTMVLSHESRPREELRQYAAEALAGLYRGDPRAGTDIGGRAEGLRRLQAFDVHRYNERGQSLGPEGSSRLSPYIRHGLLSLREVRDSVVARFGAAASRSFVVQLLWRVFWHLYHRDYPAARSAEAYGRVGVWEHGSMGAWGYGSVGVADGSPRPHAHTPTPP
ncbi:MAG: hypothetical protein HY321_22360, partial [Armatimonadetes bacterium]|nr:hypothetical protein [Armatimonadota bacterium]